MRRIVGVLSLLATLAFVAPAAAKHRVLAPPGNSGVSQYVESIPTAQGNQPTTSVHRGGGGGGGGSGQGGSGAISTSTQHSLAAQGPVGQQAAAVLGATAPRGRGHRSGARGNSAPSIPPVSATSSPASSVLKTLTGSSSSGGLGLLLPIILVGTLVIISALAVLRRRGRATS